MKGAANILPPSVGVKEKEQWMKMEKNELEGKREDEDVWKLSQHKVGYNGIRLESTTPHLLRTGSFCKICSVFQEIQTY